MARTISLVLVVAVASIFLSSRASALSSACTSTLMTLAPCLGYINGKLPTPSAQCCSQLDTVLKSQAECLCAILTGESSSYGIQFNQTQALTLPAACNVKAPSLSECNGTNAGVSGATESAAARNNAPAAAPSAPPSGADDPAAAVASTAPVPTAHDGHGDDHSHEDAGKGSTTSSESSRGITNKSTLSMLFATVFLSACVSSLAV